MKKVSVAPFPLLARQNQESRLPAHFPIYDSFLALPALLSSQGSSGKSIVPAGHPTFFNRQQRPRLPQYYWGWGSTTASPLGINNLKSQIPTSYSNFFRYAERIPLGRGFPSRSFPNTH